MSTLFLNVKESHAYLDPGTGSMLIQGVLAVIAVAGVSLGIFWKRIKAFFGKNTNPNLNGEKEKK